MSDHFNSTCSMSRWCESRVTFTCTFEITKLKKNKKNKQKKTLIIQYPLPSHEDLNKPWELVTKPWGKSYIPNYKFIDSRFQFQFEVAFIQPGHIFRKAATTFLNCFVFQTCSGNGSDAWMAARLAVELYF